jgi:hypothetical protein
MPSRECYEKELDELLCQRYPLIFAERHLSQMQTCMCWGTPAAMAGLT